MFRAGSFFRPLDAAVWVAITCASAWGFAHFQMVKGSRAVIYVADKKYGWYDLAGPRQELTVPTRIGPVRVEVGGGTVRVLHSPCPNKICMKTGAIRMVHSEIVCMPARLLVTVEGDGGEDAGGTDAVTY